MNVSELSARIKAWAVKLGFDDIGVTEPDLTHVSREYRDWLRRGFHGEMGYMARNVDKRLDPSQLLPGTVRVISARMNYLPSAAPRALTRPTQAYISRYALGRDYHKVVRRRLAKLARQIVEEAGGTHRAFVDSAPVLEKPLAVKAGLGWVGKNTLVLNADSGSYFFLGEIFTDIPLELTLTTEPDQCGSCKACLVQCPTNAFIAPRKLDARRCISYLTIESKEPIPLDLRPLIGNRVFGCDDCQLVCPWNRFAPETQIRDFQPRHGLDEVEISTLLRWNEQTFRSKTQGTAIRRINYTQWVRNLAVAAGNSVRHQDLVDALEDKLSEMRARGHDDVVEHLTWALNRLNDETQERQNKSGTTVVPEWKP